MLPIKFGVSGVSRYDIAADIRLNVKKEYRNLVYTSRPLSHQVPISYIGMPEPKPSNIQVLDTNETQGSIDLHVHQEPEQSPEAGLCLHKK